MHYPSSSSDLQTTSKAVSARTSILTGFYVQPAAADATLTIYDNATSAAGKVVCQLLVKASTSGSMQFLPAGGLNCLNGIYASIAGAGASYIIYFNEI